MTSGKIKKILVPLDGSKNSLRGLKRAIKLAKSCDTGIVGLNIIYAPPAFAISRPKIKFKDSLSKDSRKYIEEAKEISEKFNVSFEDKIVYGSDPGYDIVKFSQKGKYDMIVMGARGLNPIKKILMGSVSNYVVNHSSIPVLIVK